MQTVLEQSAIDALFAAQSPSVESTEPISAVADSYDFGRAGHISNDQMRAITMVNDHFARSLMQTLGAWLRVQTQAVLVAGEQMPYGDFLARIPEPCCVSVLRLEPLGASGLLQMDLPLALSMVDLLLGGTGRSDEERELTDIEKAVLASVIEVFLRELNLAWQTVGLQFGLEECKDDTELGRLMPRNERTLSVSLELEMMQARGALNFCLPVTVLNTLQRKLGRTSQQPRSRQGLAGGRVAALIGSARLTAAMRLPAVRLSSRKLHELMAGTVLELPLSKAAHADLWVNGVRMCSVQPVTLGSRRAARLPGLPESPEAAEQEAAA